VLVLFAIVGMATDHRLPGITLMRDRADEVSPACSALESLMLGTLASGSIVTPHHRVARPKTTLVIVGIVLPACCCRRGRHCGTSTRLRESERPELLRSVPIFAPLRPRCSSGSRRADRGGARCGETGSPQATAATFYVIESGRAEVVVDGGKPKPLGRGTSSARSPCSRRPAHGDGSALDALRLQAIRA